MEEDMDLNLNEDFSYVNTLTVTLFDLLLFRFLMIPLPHIDTTTPFDHTASLLGENTEYLTVGHEMIEIILCVATLATQNNAVPDI